MMLLDGKPVNSCSYLALQAEGSEITTVEGLADGDDLAPLQAAFLEHGGVQCGFCTPGMLDLGDGALAGEPRPDRGRGADRALRESLPLHRLRRDREGRELSGRRRTKGWTGAAAGQGLLESRSGTSACLRRAPVVQASRAPYGRDAIIVTFASTTVRRRRAGARPARRRCINRGRSVFATVRRGALTSMPMPMRCLSTVHCSARERSFALARLRVGRERLSGPVRVVPVERGARGRQRRRCRGSGRRPSRRPSSSARRCSRSSRRGRPTRRRPAGRRARAPASSRGSTTDMPSTPIRQVHDGCSAVSASRATQSRISSSLSTDGPGESSPALNGSNAGWVRIVRAQRTASSHSRRSCSVER